MLTRQQGLPMSYYQETILADDADAAHALLRLRAVLVIVDQMADETEQVEAPVAIDQQMLDEAASLALAYANIPSVTRRRFDALAGEAAGFAEAGIAALMRHNQRLGRNCTAAARQLGAEMRQSIEAMGHMLESPARR
jgi:hypothetical protein